MIPSNAPTIRSIVHERRNSRTWWSQISGQKPSLFSYSNPRGERKVGPTVTPSLSQFNTPEAANLALATQSNCYAKLTVNYERIVGDAPSEDPALNIIGMEEGYYSSTDESSANIERCHQCAHHSLKQCTEDEIRESSALECDYAEPKERKSKADLHVTPNLSRFNKPEAT